MSVERMQKDGMIDYGQYLPTSILEKYLNVKFDGTWEYLGPYLDLKEQIESLGYMCSARGCPAGSMRILNIDEMSEKAEKIRVSILNKQKRVIKSLTHADISLLNDNDRRSHERVTLKSTLSLQSMKSILAGI